VYRKRTFLEQYLNAGYAPKYLVTEFYEVRRFSLLRSHMLLYFVEHEVFSRHLYDGQPRQVP
jgi:hypothetical protein